MSQVTNRLAALESEMTELIAWRNARLKSLKNEIVWTNREFDEKAIALGKKINQLRKDLTPPSKPVRITSQRQFEIPSDGFDDDEVRHYQELLERKS